MLARPVGRTIAIAVLDLAGQPAAGATVRIAINGREAGAMRSGSGPTPLSIEVFNPNALVEIEATLLTQTQRQTALPGQDRVVFSFASIVRFATGVAAVAECPDGRRGNPCVMCFDGNDHWRLCS